jgi:hypothetical protein
LLCDYQSHAIADSRGQPLYFADFGTVPQRNRTSFIFLSGKNVLFWHKKKSIACLKLYRQDLKFLVDILSFSVNGTH